MVEFPLHLVRTRKLADGRTVTIRPVRAGDERAEAQFLESLSGESQRLRFLNYVQAPGDRLVHFFTHIDYDRHMAFVCEAEGGELVGEARYVANADGRSCEFGVVVADHWRHSGMARLLMDALIRAAQARKLETMEGLVLSDNQDMLKFASALGFELTPDAVKPALVRVTRKL
ncbi:MAG: GNAT family N-acetyltransferase [Betaproteobacteria bacterium]|nr:GNAT family N-acetyltransferase [Betaproteobacteria bacterium]